MNRDDSNQNAHIFLGDAIDVINNQVKDGSLDLIFADPPYNIGKKFKNNTDKWSSTDAYFEWYKSWLDLCIEKLKPSGSIYLMSSTQEMPKIDTYVNEKLHILSRIVWHYDSSGVQAKKYFGSLYEPILFAVKNKNQYTFNSDEILVEAKTGAKRKLIDYRGETPKPYSTEKVPGNVWYFPRVRYRMEEYEDHPTQKPESLLERIILASSNPGDTILDPFSGTFTTGAVALKNDRKFIGIELEEAYYKIGLRRLGLADSYDGEILERPNKYKKEVNPNEKLFN